MTVGAIEYSASRASERQVFDHLVRCDGRYNPPLSHRVDIGEYARKLHARARTLEAWHGGELIGLVAIYLDEPGERAFISSVSVDEAFAGAGIGSRLVDDAVSLARSRGIRGISLEVSRQSPRAIQIYEKHGFRVAAETGEAETLQMHLSISEQV